MKYLYKYMFFFSLIFLFHLPVSADSGTYHVIDSYEFDIPGKTSENAVRRVIVPKDGDPPFESEEALDEALNKKKQALFNKRIFNQVEYSYDKLYSEDNTTYYQANFFIDDSFTFLPLPYGKYDSNYPGFRIGLKAHDRNLFGTFANMDYVGHATQVQGKWDSIRYFSQLRIRNIPIFESTLSFFSEIEFKHQDRERIKEAAFDVRLGLRDLDIFDNTLSFETRLEMEQIDSDGDTPMFGDGTLSLSTDIGRIRIFDEPFRFSHTLSLLQTEDTWSYPDFDSDLRLTWLDLSLFNHPYAVFFRTSQSFSTQNRDIASNSSQFGISSSFSQPFDLNHSASLSLSFDMSHIFSVPKNYKLSTTHTFTRGSINWNNNFREGAEALFRFNGDFSFKRGYEDFSDRFQYSLRGELTTFWLLWDRLNISTRTLGFYAHRPLGKDYPTFLPGRNVNATDKLRGVLRANYDGQAEREFGLTFNLNLTFLAIKIDGFAESFITPFFDFGLFHNDNANNHNTNLIQRDDLDILATVGVEGHGIFDRYRSYPFRGSIGFNLFDLNEYVHGNISFSDIEKEIVITMELHF